MTSFHVYTHQDNTVDTIENCSICDLAVQNQNSEFTFVAILMLVLLSVIIFTGKKLSPLVFEVPSFYFQYAIFGRPPPFN